MANFTWRWTDAYTKVISSEGGIDDYHNELRKYINEKGIHTKDSFRETIFSVIIIGRMTWLIKTIDLIFEYKPDLTMLSESNRNTVAMHFGFLRLYNFVVIKRFLEQDTDYRYIRCRYARCGCLFDNFMYFLDHYNRTYNKDGKHDNTYTGVYLFRNHFCKGITFFELMKHQLFK